MSGVAPSAGPSGVLVVDKPGGVTSHDVVQRVRRLLQTRRVGHAGTLNPLASGVLVVMVGEATKLAPYLTAEDKSYRARVRLGTATTTLDAEGEVTAQCELPAWLGEPDVRAARLAEAVAAERQRSEQRPPDYSAIKLAGRTAYARARAGETVHLPPRPVVVLELTVEHVELELASSAAGTPPQSAAFDVWLRVGKGYYVRSLARDLGERLGLPAHLESLRRLTAGAFGLGDATPLDAPPAELAARLLGLAQAARTCLPSVTLGETGLRRALLGQPLELTDFADEPPRDGTAAWIAADGTLVAVGSHCPDAPARVLRGFGPRAVAR